MKKVLSLAVLATCFVLTSCIPNNRISEKVTSKIKYSVGDNLEWASPDFNDSNWKTLERNSLEVGSVHYAWIRTEATVPARLLKDSVWLGMDRFNAAADIYADGVYVGSRGNLPPNTRVRVEENTDVCIPLSAIHNGNVKIAVRCYCPADKIIDLGFSFDNKEQAYFQNVIHNQFGPRFFLILTYLCIFRVCRYSNIIFVYFNRRNFYIIIHQSIIFI